MMETIIMQNTKCTLRFGNYSNTTIKMEAYNALTGELCIVPTIDFEKEYGPGYGDDFLFPFVVIKNYGEEHGMYEALESQGVIQMGIPIINDKDIDVFAALLTDKWMTIAKEQLNL